MKNIPLLLLIIITAFSSCKKEEIPLINPDLDTPNFIGNWERKYDILGSEFTASYFIDSTQIIYKNEGNGPGNAEYTIQFDSYNEDENRWIGHTEENKYYLIFFKNITSTNITLYKQKVNDPNEAQEIDIPADDNNQNYGWNTYQKQ